MVSQKKGKYNDELKTKPTKLPKARENAGNEVSAGKRG